MFVYFSEGFSGQQEIGANYALSQNTDYLCEVSLNEGVVSLEVMDMSDVTLYQRTYSFDTTDLTKVLPNTGRFTFWSFGGTHTIKNVEVSSEQLTDADYLIVGDSVARGYSPNALLDRYVSRMAADNPDKTFEVLAGFGDRCTTEVSSRVNEIVALAPKNVVLSILSTDIEDGVAQGTRRSAYDNIISTLESNGINVILTTIVPRNDVDVSVENAFIIGHTNQIVDLNAMLSGPGTGLNTQYDSGDGIHPNNAGHLLIGQLISDAVVSLNTRRVLLNLCGGNEVQNPDPNGRNWNNISSDGANRNASTAGYSFPSIVDTGGNLATITFTLDDPFDNNFGDQSGRNQGGGTALDVGDYVNPAGLDSWFSDEPDEGSISIGGLDPNRSYTIKFWGSRSDIGNRSIDIATQSDFSDLQSYVADNNTDPNNAVIFTVTGLASQTFYVRSTPGGVQFGYISVIDIQDEIGEDL